MTTPRIGETVHYTLTGAENPCCAALICDVLNGGEFLTLRVYEPNASVSFGAHQARADPGMGWHDFTPDTPFTPGTWHHIH